MGYLQNRLNKRLQDPEFKREWEDSELEYLIARNIIAKRKEQNLTQKQLAEAINTTQSVISRIEKGEQNLTLQTMKSLAASLDIKVHDLMVYEEKEEYKTES